ncbi:hypothetical protein SLS58_004313 [Diplodia intermedia]|uniref:Uncharacterized protein n=1 Tax=Diplodia intermedia TaxID=856260 RepID=A0ABR3TTT0_9PEZI
MYTVITEYYEDEAGAVTATSMCTVTNQTVADYISTRSDSLWAALYEDDGGVIYYPDPELRVSHYAYGRSTVVSGSVATVSQVLTVTSPTRFVHEAALRVLEVPPKTSAEDGDYCPRDFVESYLRDGIGVGDQSQVFKKLDLTASVPPFIATGSSYAGISYIPQAVISTLAEDSKVIQQYPGIRTCIAGRIDV